VKPWIIPLLALAGAACGDPCGDDEYRFVWATMELASGASAAPGNFVLTTPPARKECPARLHLRFAWKDDARRTTDGTPPPVDCSFMLEDRSAFPTPRPVCEWVAGEHWCRVERSADAVGETADSVSFAIEAWASGATADAILAIASIDYVPAPPE